MEPTGKRSDKYPLTPTGATDFDGDSPNSGILFLNSLSDQFYKRGRCDFVSPVTGRDVPGRATVMLDEFGHLDSAAVDCERTSRVEVAT